jgi:RNA polymerase sigma factor (sigma-70 family)
MKIILTGLDESQLVKECLKGKQDSQKHLYELYASKMLGVCYRYASSRAEAEDFLQEAFISVFRKLHQFKGEGELGAWIRRIVVNTSLNGIKARHHFSDHADSIDIELVKNTFVHEPLNDTELMELVHQLPTGYRTVFNLYAIEGYSHDEIAKKLDIRPGTSRSQFMKARKMLMLQLNAQIKKEIK